MADSLQGLGWSALRRLQAFAELLVIAAGISASLNRLTSRIASLKTSQRRRYKGINAEKPFGCWFVEMDLCFIGLSLRKYFLVKRFLPLKRIVTVCIFIRFHSSACAPNHRLSYQASHLLGRQAFDFVANLLTLSPSF